MRFITICLLLAYGAVSKADDEWLGSDNSGGLLVLRHGFYEDEARSTGFDTTLPLFRYSQLHLLYARYDDTEEPDSEHWAIYWNSDPVQRFSVGFGYEENGEGSLIVNQDAHVYLDYEIDLHWSLRGKLAYGEVEIDVSDIPGDIAEQFASLGYLDRTRRGFGLGLDYEGDSWGARLSANYYDYEDPDLPDLEGSQSSTRLLLEESLRDGQLLLKLLYSRVYERFRELGFDNEQAGAFTDLLFTRNESELRTWARDSARQRRISDSAQTRFFYRTAYGRQNLLSKSDIGAEMHWRRGDFSYHTGVLNYESYVTEEHNTQLYAGIDYQWLSQLSLGLAVNYSDELSDFYSEVSLGISW